MTITTAGPRPLFRDAAQADNKKSAVHRWVPWVAGYSSHFVDDVFDHYLPNVVKATVMDPFAGVGTTLIQAQRRGWDSIGFEINAYAAMACEAKLDAANISVSALAGALEQYRVRVGRIEARLNSGLTVLPPRSAAPAGFKTKIPFYSEHVLPKALHTLDFISELPDDLKKLFRLAFASMMVSFSNYTYEPSLGSRPGAGKALIEDASVVDAVGGKLAHMLDDLALVNDLPTESSWVVHESSFMDTADGLIAPNSVDLVLTSPPYLNNYHYVRNTRPQMYWLNFANSPQDLRKLEETNFGRFWQTVRDQDTVELDFKLPELEDQLDQIRSLNQTRGVYGGHGWANYASTYYNDVNRCLAVTSSVLKQGGAAIFVVGNSIIQGVHLKIDEHFAAIGELHGLVAEDIHVVREKRVGSSIVNTGLRSRGEKIRLYDAATVLRKP